MTVVALRQSITDAERLKVVPEFTPGDLGDLARELGLSRPISLKALIGALGARPPQTKQYTYNIVTGSGDPFGGSVTLTISSDGTYNIHFHETMSQGPSAVTPFNYHIRAYLSAPAAPIPTLFFYHAGTIAGNVTSQGVQDYNEPGTNPLIQLYWPQIVESAELRVAYDDTFALAAAASALFGDLESIGNAAAGLIVAACSEAIQWLGQQFGGIGETIGVITGALVFVVGALAGLPVGAALLLATVAGLTADAIANNLIQTRPMLPEEITTAQTVFGSTIPYNKIRFTNLNLQPGRAFTAPGVDGNTYCNFGALFSGITNPMTAVKNDAYKAPGELMIHELAHAWQIAHNSFWPGFICSALVNGTEKKFGDNVYQYSPPPGPPWSSYNLEQQASIVNEWFAGNSDPAAYVQYVFLPEDKTDNPWFQYIQDNILTESAGFSWNP